MKVTKLDSYIAKKHDSRHEGGSLQKEMSHRDNHSEMNGRPRGDVIEISEEARALFQEKQQVVQLQREWPYLLWLIHQAEQSAGDKEPDDHRAHLKMDLRTDTYDYERAIDEVAERLMVL
jgi:hypothetical protein